MPLLRTQRDESHASHSQTTNVSVEWPPGVPGYMPGFMFQAETVHVRRSFPGTILRSLATGSHIGSALPIRPIFSKYETRETGPKLYAFIRQWWWRGPNQNVLQDQGGLHYVSVVGAATSPGGSMMSARRRITSTVDVPSWSTTPNSMTPTGQQGQRNRMGSNNRVSVQTRNIP